MIGIHPVHRRLAELHLIATHRPWTRSEVIEVHQCLRINADIVQRLDGLKQLAFQAHLVGDYEWKQEICAKIDAIEATMI